MMRAALVTSEGKLDVSEVSSPEPGEGDAAVSVSYCGICGSDIHGPGQVKVLIDCRE